VTEDKFKSFLLSYFSERSGLNLNELHEEADIFAEAYIDSLGVFGLVAEVEENFSISLTEEDMLSEKFRSIGGLVELLSAKEA